MKPLRHQELRRLFKKLYRSRKYRQPMRLLPPVFKEVTAYLAAHYPHYTFEDPVAWGGVLISGQYPDRPAGFTVLAPGLYVSHSIPSSLEQDTRTLLKSLEHF